MGGRDWGLLHGGGSWELDTWWSRHTEDGWVARFKDDGAVDGRLLVQTGVRHAAETVVGTYAVSVASSEATRDLLCLEMEVVAADLLCVVPVAELLVGCLTSGAVLLPETIAGLFSMTTAALTVGLTGVVLTVVTAVATPPGLPSTTSV